MPITIYNISGSPSGWRVLIGLELKGLNYDVENLRVLEGEHKQHSNWCQLAWLLILISL